MGTQPWGPHGPTVPAHTTTPNPTAASPAPAFEHADYSAPPMPSGDGVVGGFLANIIMSAVVVLLVWEAFVCLYPMSVIAAIAAWRVIPPMVNTVAPAELKGDLGYLAGVAAVLVAIGVVIRIEYRLAQNTGFRIVRHAVRMVLLSLWAIPILMLCMGASYPKSTTLFIYSVVTSPPTMVQFLSNPVRLAIWAAFMIGLHFMIWNWAWARRFWHRRLKFVGLGSPADL